VRTYAGATGLKTGYYAQAGFGVTATAKRGDLHLIAVVLGVRDKQRSFAEAAKLMSQAFADWKVVVAARRGVAVSRVPVSGGTEPMVAAMPTQDLRVLVKRTEDKGVAVEARIPRLLQAPVSPKQPMGEVIVRRGDQELGRVPVVAGGEVASTGWLAWLWNRKLGAQPASVATATP
jgi:D-alanyl-D-alanine carboxypeptidase (penicillin-binding protein 5/6)